MSTPFDASNAINLAETAAVNTIGADAWLKVGGTGGVMLVHQKIRATSDDPFALYLITELPAIGVLAGQGEADDRIALQEFEEYIRLGFDVWVASGELDVADTTAKQIVAQLRRLMRLQAFSTVVESESSQLDGFAADGEIHNEGYDFEYFNSENGTWLVHGVTYSTILVLSSSTE